jgi:putative cell wall-binding protein
VHRLIAAALAVLLLPSLLAVPAAADEGIAGLVEGPGGDPVEGALVHVVAAEDPDVVVVEATTDADGAWQADVEDGEHLVHVADPSGALADGWYTDAGLVADADVVTAGMVDLVQVLAEAGSIAGTVEGHDGPVAGVTLRVARTPFWVLESTTASDGTFRLDGLRAGTHLVEVDPGDLALSGTTAEVAVDPGAVSEIGFILRPRPIGVERVAGPERVATAVEASRRGFAVAETVVIAGAGSFPDALAAAPLAATVGGPLLLIGRRLSADVAEELRRLRASEVVIVGAIAAVPLVAQEDLGRLGLDVRRIAGEDRFDTAALIAREVGAEDGRAIVASGHSFADALSVAPYAASERMPILLTAPEGLHADAAAALRALGVTETLVVGGESVVSRAVLDALPSPTRVSGLTRYETSLAIAEHWAARGMRLETVHVATGRDFPDALAAGPVAALARGPLLLVDGLDADVPEDTYRWLAQRSDDIDGAYAFGGEAVMAEAVLDRLRRAIGASS